MIFTIFIYPVNTFRHRYMLMTTYTLVKYHHRGRVFIVYIFYHIPDCSNSYCFQTLKVNLKIGGTPDNFYLCWFPVPPCVICTLPTTETPC